MGWNNYWDNKRKQIEEREKLMQQPLTQKLEQAPVAIKAQQEATKEEPKWPPLQATSNKNEYYKGDPTKPTITYKEAIEKWNDLIRAGHRSTDASRKIFLDYNVKTKRAYADPNRLMADPHTLHSAFVADHPEHACRQTMRVRRQMAFKKMIEQEELQAKEAAEAKKEEERKAAEARAAPTKEVISPPHESFVSQARYILEMPGASLSMKKTLLKTLLAE